jgi:hypothetical protein
MEHAWHTALIVVGALGLTTAGCGGKQSSPSGEGEGGLQTTGGTAVTGGQSRGSGGRETGGAETGATAGLGGGGTDMGGSSTGGRGQGGTSTGGMGGADTGGTGQSGSSSGGAVGGGANTGGSTQGGMGSGGEGHGGIVSGGEGGVPAGGQTGTGATGGECDPPLSCNWCSGTTVYDADGCVVGYVCANGVDPCSTSACQDKTDCDPEDVCGADGLCWPATSQCTVVSTGDGFVTCDEGYIHREEPLACTISVPRTDYECSGGTCTTDSDCAHLSYGHCSPNPLSMGVCSCFEGCQTDADCDANMLCQCLPSLGVGRCVVAQCSSDADCDPGRHCATYTGFACGVVEGFACQTDEDECASDSDCGPGACQLGPGGHRICDSCAIS